MKTSERKSNYISERVLRTTTNVKESNLNRIHYNFNFMRHLKTLLLCLLFPMAMTASVWDTEYKQIEKNIKAPVFADRTFNITKYGASVKATAAKNQKAINKAIIACNKAGGGRVVIPAGKSCCKQRCRGYLRLRPRPVSPGIHPLGRAGHNELSAVHICHRL